MRCEIESYIAFVQWWSTSIVFLLTLIEQNPLP